MGWDLNEAFSIFVDGSKKTKAIIKDPSDTYRSNTPYALVKDELFIFEGRALDKKVRKSEKIEENIFKNLVTKLEGCTWKTMSTKLINKMSGGSAALTIDNGEKALIFFPEDGGRKCEIFDSEQSVSTHSTSTSHNYGKLGFYKGKPTAVGGTKKVETFNSYRWSTLPEFSRSLKIIDKIK